MTIEVATIADLEAALAIHPARRAQLHELVNSSTRSGECWIAKLDERPIGLMVLQYTFYGNGFVPLLLVHESARRRGVGRALLAYAVSICRTPKLFTSTNESNLPMQLLLAASGFEPSGIIYNLDSGDPELVYVRRSQ